MQLDRVFKAAVGLLEEGSLDARTHGKRIIWQVSPHCFFFVCLCTLCIKCSATGLAASIDDSTGLQCRERLKSLVRIRK